MNVLPDITALTIEMLQAHEGVGALELAGIAEELPADAQLPFLTVFAVAPTRDRHWRGSSVQQFDVWWSGDGSQRDQANLIARTVEAALLEDGRNFSGDNGVIVQTESVISVRPLPDSSTERHRFEFEVRIAAHPNPA